MKKAVTILNTLATDDEVRRLAEDREARIRLDAMYRRQELSEAREEVRQEIARKAINGVRAGLVSAAYVASLLEMDVAEVERLAAAERNGSV